MKSDPPGFMRELPIALLILAIILAFVFWPIYRHYKQKAEDLRSTKAQEIVILDELVEEAPESLGEPESDEDPDDISD